MEIHLSPEQERNLAERATAKGFGSAEEYAETLLGHYAAGAAELEQSAKSLIRARSQYLNEGGRQARETIRGIAEKLGVSLDQ